MLKPKLVLVKNIEEETAVSQEHLGDNYSWDISHSTSMPSGNISRESGTQEKSISMKAELKPGLYIYVYILI